jgi:hypothetical protein
MHMVLTGKFELCPFIVLPADVVPGAIEMIEIDDDSPLAEEDSLPTVPPSGIRKEPDRQSFSVSQANDRSNNVHAIRKPLRLEQFAN